VITELILYSWSAGETSATILDNLPEYGQNGKNRLQFDAVLSASPGSGRYIICVISAEVHWIEHFSRKKNILTRGSSERLWFARHNFCIFYLLDFRHCSQPIGLKFGHNAWVDWSRRH